MKYKNLTRPMPQIYDPSLTRYNKIRLDKNECGDQYLSKFLFQEIKKKLTWESIAVYPETDNIYTKLSHFHNLNINQIYIDSGSDAVIRSIFQAFISPNDKVVIPEPTYAMYDVYCKLFQANKITIPYYKFNKQHQIELPYKNIFKHKDAKIIIIANPDSPTGYGLYYNAQAEIADFAAKNNILFVLDEAYFSYSYHSAIPVSCYPTLIKIRTFSKIFSLAGLRFGYAFGDEKLIKQLHKQKPIHEVNQIAVIGAEVALENISRIKNSTASVIDRKINFENELMRLGFKILSTSTNFIHVKLNSTKYHEILQDNNIFYRKKQKGCLRGYSRFSIGTRKEMNLVIQLLRKTKIEITKSK